MEKIKQIISDYNLHSQSFERLGVFVSLLQKWSSAYNLIGPNEFDQIWERHILDSVQLATYLPPLSRNPRIVDLGSGAGFPGVILALLGYSDVYLVEKSQKKTMFLETVSRETEVPFRVVQSRIEDSYSIFSNADIVTSRALSDLTTLLKYSHTIMHERSFCLFLKGSALQDEIIEAKKYFSFDYEIYNGITDQTNRIIKIHDLFPSQN